MKSNLKGSLILILTALIWGMAFVAQSTATDYMGPFTFVCIRFGITSLVLFATVPFFLRMDKHKPENFPYKSYLKYGALMGVLLFAACELQQIGIAQTTAAKSGFITALYIVMIPLIGIFMGKRIGRLIWIGVVIALVGLCLLCLNDDLTVNTGDLITLACAVMFSLHIIVVDKYAGSLNSVLLSAIQFGTGALISLPIMLTESPDVSRILACWPSMLYAAVCSGAIGYTLQVVGQKYTEPTLASLILCLEAVFAAVGGWILLGEVLNLRELAGCVLLLSASIIAQMPDKRAALNQN